MWQGVGPSKRSYNPARARPITTLADCSSRASCAGVRRDAANFLVSRSRAMKSMRTRVPYQSPSASNSGPRATPCRRRRWGEARGSSCPPNEPPRGLHAHGVHALRRQELARRWSADVDRPEAEPAPPPRARARPCRHGVGAPEAVRGVRKVATGHAAADRRARDGAAVAPLHRRHHVHAERRASRRVPGARRRRRRGRGRSRGRSRPAVRACRSRSQQHLVDELLGVVCRERGRERKHDRVVDACSRRGLRSSPRRR